MFFAVCIMGRYRLPDGRRPVCCAPQPAITLRSWLATLSHAYGISRFDADASCFCLIYLAFRSLIRIFAPADEKNVCQEGVPRFILSFKIW